MERILIATDGSPGGREAVEQGLSLASSAGAHATVVYVRKRPHEFLGDAYYQRTLSGALAEAWQVIDSAVARATDLDVDAEGEIMEGDAAEEIVSLARSREVDMIVVGSRALGPIAGTLLGSVSRSVVRDADRPVLVVTPRPEAERAAA